MSLNKSIISSLLIAILFSNIAAAELINDNDRMKESSSQFEKMTELLAGRSEFLQAYCMDIETKEFIPGRVVEFEDGTELDCDEHIKALQDDIKQIDFEFVEAETVSTPGNISCNELTNSLPMTIENKSNLSDIIDSTSEALQCKPFSFSACGADLGCNALRSFIGLVFRVNMTGKRGSLFKLAEKFYRKRGLDLKESSSYEKLKQCLDTSKPSCLDTVVRGIIDNLFFNLEMIWGLAELAWTGVKNVGTGINNIAVDSWDWMVGAEDATSDKLMVAQGTDDGALNKFLSDPLGAVQDLFKGIWANILNSVTDHYGCQSWSGEPFKSQCLVPLSLDCASCGAVMNATCGVAGFIGGQYISTLLTGGAIGLIKVPLNVTANLSSKVLGHLSKTVTAQAVKRTAGAVTDIVVVGGQYVSTPFKYLTKSGGRLGAATLKTMSKQWVNFKNLKAVGAISKYSKVMVPKKKVATTEPGKITLAVKAFTAATVNLSQAMVYLPAQYFSFLSHGYQLGLRGSGYLVDKTIATAGLNTSKLNSLYLGDGAPILRQSKLYSTQEKLNIDNQFSMQLSKIKGEEGVVLSESIRKITLTTERKAHLVSYMEYVNTLKAGDKIMAFKNADQIFLIKSYYPKNVAKFVKMEKKLKSIEKAQQTSISNKLQREGIAPKIAEQKASALAKTNMLRRKELIMSCASHKTNSALELAGTRLKRFSVVLGLGTTSYGFLASQPDTIDKTVMLKLGFELTNSIIGSYLAAAIISDLPAALSIAVKTAIDYNVGALRGYVDNTIYAKFFDLSDEEAAKQLDEIAKDPEKMKEIEKLIKILENKRFYQQWRSNIGRFFAENYDSVKDFLLDFAGEPMSVEGSKNIDWESITADDIKNNKEIRETLIDAVQMAFYEDNIGAAIQTGDMAADRWVFHRLQALITIPKSTVVLAVIYKSMCLGIDNPSKALLKAIALVTVDKMSTDPTFLQIRQDAIKQ